MSTLVVTKSRHNNISPIINKASYTARGRWILSDLCTKGTNQSKEKTMLCLGILHWMLKDDQRRKFFEQVDISKLDQGDHLDLGHKNWTTARVYFSEEEKTKYASADAWNEANDKMFKALRKETVTWIREHSELFTASPLLGYALDNKNFASLDSGKIQEDTPFLGAQQQEDAYDPGRLANLLLDILIFKSASGVETAADGITKLKDDKDTPLYDPSLLTNGLKAYLPKQELFAGDHATKFDEYLKKAEGEIVELSTLIGERFKNDEVGKEGADSDEEVDLETIKALLATKGKKGKALLQAITSLDASKSSSQNSPLTEDAATTSISTATNNNNNNVRDESKKDVENLVVAALARGGTTTAELVQKRKVVSNLLGKVVCGKFGNNIGQVAMTFDEGTIGADLMETLVACARESSRLEKLENELEHENYNNLGYHVQSAMSMMLNGMIGCVENAFKAQKIGDLMQYMRLAVLSDTICAASPDMFARRTASRAKIENITGYDENYAIIDALECITYLSIAVTCLLTSHSSKINTWRRTISGEKLQGIAATKRAWKYLCDFILDNVAGWNQVLTSDSADMILMAQFAESANKVANGDQTIDKAGDGSLFNDISNRFQTYSFFAGSSKKKVGESPLGAVGLAGLVRKRGKEDGDTNSGRVPSNNASATSAGSKNDNTKNTNSTNTVDAAMKKEMDHRFANMKNEILQKTQSAKYVPPPKRSQQQEHSQQQQTQHPQSQQQHDDDESDDGKNDQPAKLSRKLARMKRLNMRKIRLAGSKNVPKRFAKKKTP